MLNREVAEVRKHCRQLFREMRSQIHLPFCFRKRIVLYIPDALLGHCKANSAPPEVRPHGEMNSEPNFGSERNRSDSCISNHDKGFTENV